MERRQKVNVLDRFGLHYAGHSLDPLGLHCYALDRHIVLDHSSRKGCPCLAGAFHWEIATIDFESGGCRRRWIMHHVVTGILAW